MDFSLNSEQRALVEMARDFAEKELRPNYTRWDRTKQFPTDIWKQMGELGLIGLRIPIEYGGLGLDCLTTGLIIEQIARGDYNVGNVLLVCALVPDILAKHASEKIKSEWLPAIARAEKLVVLSLTEPHAGSDAANLKLRAVREGGAYRINGEKSGTTLLKQGDASLVFARTALARGAHGISAFLVPFDGEGVERQYFEDMGSRPITRGSLFLDDVVVPAENLVGAEGSGFVQVMQGFDYSRILIGLVCLGVAEISLEETIAYIKEREAFGRQLAKFQGVSFPIAEHYTAVEQAKLLCYKGLWLRDQGLPHTKEAAMAKYIGPKTAVAVIHDCLLLHGHYGYTQDLPFEQRLRDAIGLEIGDGTAQISKLIISRELLGKEFAV